MVMQSEKEDLYMYMYLYIFIHVCYNFREIYHTKRMQRVEVVRWSLDNKYILSGSDEMNIRIWKANASEKLGVVSIRLK